MSTHPPIDLDKDPLALRLTALEIATPEFQAAKPAAAVKPQVFAGAARERRNSRGRMVLAFALLVVGVAATYPAIGQEALRWAGLLPEQVQPLHGSARYGSVVVEVSGGYADQIDTVIFASFTQNAACGGGPFLTDQYGERYQPTGGWGLGVGAYPILFEPLRGQATQGALLTLHCVLYFSPPSTHDIAVKMSGKLTPGTATPIAAPLPIVTDGTTYEVVDLVWSGTYLKVHTRISGKLIADLVAKMDALKPPANLANPTPTVSGVTFPGVFLAPPGGSPEIPIASTDDVQAVFDRLEKDHVLDEVRVFRADHAGAYRIEVNLGEPRSPAIVSWTVSVR